MPSWLRRASASRCRTVASRSVRLWPSASAIGRSPGTPRSPSAASARSAASRRPSASRIAPSSCSVWALARIGAVAMMLPPSSARRAARPRAGRWLSANSSSVPPSRS
ncbi:hypothetical protein TSH58_24305 [Azospirillum sp. TSH58]|nr:hypothetical protein TSH58_24305 [Azospirillum sp. TSH58]